MSDMRLLQEARPPQDPRMVSPQEAGPGGRPLPSPREMRRADSRGSNHDGRDPAPGGGRLLGPDGRVVDGRFPPDQRGPYPDGRGGYPAQPDSSRSPFTEPLDGPPRAPFTSQQVET